MRSMRRKGNSSNVILKKKNNCLYKFLNISQFSKALLTFTCERWWGRRFKEYRFGIRALLHKNDEIIKADRLFSLK